MSFLHFGALVNVQELHFKTLENVQIITPRRTRFKAVFRGFLISLQLYLPKPETRVRNELCGRGVGLKGRRAKKMETNQ